MKHLYWIICGVLAVGLIVTWLVVVPTAEARAGKDKLDNDAKDLGKLKKAADNKLEGVFDAENTADTDRLASEFLITEKWEKVLQEKLDKYRKHLDDLKAQLLGRGAWLRTKVADTPDTLAWYTAYVTASEALVTRLRTAGCLPPAATDDVLSDRGESPARVRTAAGLFTMSSSFPEPAKHPQLTAQLRVMEMIAARLIAGRIAIADNPLVGPTGRSADRAQAAAIIQNVEWQAAGQAEQITNPIRTVVSELVESRALGLTLTLAGPPSALLAASSALERNAEADRPLIAVRSAVLSRRTETTLADRYDVASESARLVLAIDVIEFAAITAAPAEGAPQ